MLNDLLFSVVRGDPSPEEVAAVAVTLASLRHDPQPRGTNGASLWARSGRPWAPAATSWRASGMPR
jgi:hypothetical protein